MSCKLYSLSVGEQARTVVFLFLLRLLMRPAYLHLQYNQPINQPLHPTCFSISINTQKPQRELIHLVRPRRSYVGPMPPLDLLKPRDNQDHLQPIFRARQLAFPANEEYHDKEINKYAGPPSPYLSCPCRPISSTEWHFQQYGRTTTPLTPSSCNRYPLAIIPGCRYPRPP